jgi:modulator of FtsH protease HflC
MKTSFPVVVLILAVLVVVSGALYTVDETEQVVITQFGRPVGAPIREPGLHFKTPFVQKANFLPKNILEWDGDESQVPTLDKTFIMVDPFCRWQIVDPLLFLVKVRSETSAHAQLDAIINSETKNLIQSHPLIEVIRNSQRVMEILANPLDPNAQPFVSEIKMGREELTRLILEKAEAKVKDLGIHLVDVGFKGIKYIDDVQAKVFERMTAERQQIAEKFRSEGQGESRQIEGQMEKELKQIQAEAYKRSEEIKGTADAEAARIYAEAFGRDTEFYKFVKTLEIYRNLPDKEIELILSTESELFRYLKGIHP